MPEYDFNDAHHVAEFLVSLPNDMAIAWSKRRAEQQKVVGDAREIAREEKRK